MSTTNHETLPTSAEKNWNRAGLHDNIWMFMVSDGQFSTMPTLAEVTIETMAKMSPIFVYLRSWPISTDWLS